jgi:RNA 3'-terminal phosphate cyclase
MLPFALARGGAFRTGALSDHSRTNLDVIEAFLPGCVHVSVEENETIVEFGLD